MNAEKVQSSIAEYFANEVEKDSKIHNAYMLVHSDKLGIHIDLAEGSTGDMSANSQQPYFIASIGKLFTSVLIAILVEKGMVSYEDTIAEYLDDDLLKDLHVYKGKDYANSIKIKHLLNHTSGLHDYYTDKPKQGNPMMDILFEQPSRFWSPQEMIKWSKEHLKAHFPPGKGFHYSDTGYQILGLIVEKITLKPFHQALTDYIFRPLEMQHSYVANYSEPILKNDYPVANLFGRNMNVTNYQSFSIEHGDGIVAPAKDQLKFMKALVKHELITGNSFDKLKDWAGFFNLSYIGIDYGYGLMSFKTIPILVPKKYHVWGNAGSTGSFMFYNPEIDTYIIGSLNQFGYHRKGIKLLFKVVNMLS